MHTIYSPPKEVTTTLLDVPGMQNRSFKPQREEHTEEGNLEVGSWTKLSANQPGKLLT